MLLATLYLPKSLTFLRNFCKVVKIYHFSSKISFGQVLSTFGNFFWSHWSPLNMNHSGEFKIYKSEFSLKCSPTYLHIVHPTYIWFDFKWCWLGCHWWWWWWWCHRSSQANDIMWHTDHISTFNDWLLLVARELNVSFTPGTKILVTLMYVQQL